MKRAVGFIMLFLPLVTLKIAAQPISDVLISGIPDIGQALFGSYAGDTLPGNHFHFKWYRDTDTAGLSRTKTYTITSSDNAKKIYFKVTVQDAANSVLDRDSVFVLVNSIPVVSYLTVVGDPRPGLTVFASYVFSDADGDTEEGSEFRWFRATNSAGAGLAAISGADSNSYKIKDADSLKYLGFSVRPATHQGSSPGILDTTTVFLKVNSNKAPVATVGSITGSLYVNGVLTGHYTYSDPEGDLESGSTYEWSSSLTSGGTFTPISETAVSHKIDITEQGRYFKFSVVPKAGTGNNSTKKYTSTEIGKANTRPHVNGVSITGTAAVGQVLTASYSYDDVDGDPEAVDATIKQWYRGAELITGATYLSYTLTTDDVDKMITFKVIPVSAPPAYPDTGDPFTASKGPVTDPSATDPVARDLCINGERVAGKKISGEYTYEDKYNEESSEYLWLSGKTVLQSGNSISDKSYTLVSDDIPLEITFAVIPRNRRGVKGDTAFSAPLAIFDMPRYVFSESDSSQLLQAKPANGTFSGTGVSNGYFTPRELEVGFYNLTYLLPVTTPTTTCAQKAFHSFEVRPVKIAFQYIDPLFCDNNGPETIRIMNVPQGVPLISYFLINYDLSPNLVKINDSTAVFYPDLMPSGDKIDKLVYYYYDGITLEVIEQALVIEHVGTVSILSPAAGSSYCSNDPPVYIATSHSGGLFTGLVKDGKVNPSLMPGGYGDTTITYTYTSSLGCSQSASIPVTINALPSIRFAPADSCINDDTDITKMLNTTGSVDSVSSYEWIFSDAGTNVPRFGKESTYLYKTGGIHEITLTATTVKGCTSTKLKRFNFCRKPVADFTWMNECYAAGDSIHFSDATVKTSYVVRKWTFFDTDVVIDTATIPREIYYPHVAPGYMPVKLLDITGYAGCDDSITRNVYIRDKIVVPEDGYLQEFKKGEGGWVKGYESRNSWTFGKPNRTVINSAHSGDTAWYTGYDILNQKVESSSVISPCFDFINIERPMIRLWLWKRFDRNRDGVALQYKIGDAGSWEYIGAPEDGGINWFNSASIKGRPGGDLSGWTSLSAPDTRWSESRHKMDELSGKKNVKFRLAYGSLGDSQDNEGVAFDDIWIGERTRNVLLEHFSNNSSPKSSQVKALVDTVALDYKKDVINIQYHTNFPGTDPFYNENPGDANARTLYYGLIKTPYSFIDGGYNNNLFANVYDYNLADLDSNVVIRRSLMNPFFKVALNAAVSGGVLTVGGQLTALENLNADNMTLYLAVTEKENNDTTDVLGETKFYNVFRKFLPDAGGINLKKSWTKGDPYTLADQSWVIQNIKANQDIEVIAFLQNNITKEVYQAASEIETDIVVGIENIAAGAGNSFAIYPNPAVNKLTLAFKEPLSRVADIKIYDIRGVIIKTWKAEAGISEFIVDDTGLAGGIYLVRVSSGGIDLGFRKLVVSAR